MGAGHDHSHDHSHGHSHIHLKSQSERFHNAFRIGIALNVLIVIVQVYYGLISNSIALVADAGHNATDVVSLLVSWLAIRLGQLPPSDRFTFGFRKASVIAALFNSVLLMGTVSLIIYESVIRFQSGEVIETNTVIWVALLGVAVNGLTAFWFWKIQRHDDRPDLNVRSAFLHLLSDMLLSVGVVITGFLIQWTGLTIFDPLMSLLISFFILANVWKVFRSSLVMAIDGVPLAVDSVAVRSYLKSVSGLMDLSEFHLWSLSTTDAALIAHLRFPKGYFSTMGGFQAAQDVQKAVADHLSAHFGIAHATLQIEESD